jgi:hypothetical protein
MLQWLRNATEEPGGGPGATKQTLLGMIEEREEELGATAAINGPAGQSKHKPARVKDIPRRGHRQLRRGGRAMARRREPGVCAFDAQQ